MSLIHQLNEILSQMGDMDYNNVANIVFAKQLVIKLNEAGIGNEYAAPFVAAMTIELKTDLHLDDPEAFSQLVDGMTTMITKLFDFACDIATTPATKVVTFHALSSKASVECP